MNVEIEARQWLQRGLSAHRANDLIKAASCYQRAIDINGNADAWHMLGMLTHQKGDSKAALDCLQHALHHRPFEPSILANRAAVQLALGDFSQAEIDASQAARARPDLYAAWINLGLALEAMSRWKEAHIALKRAHSLRPSETTLKALQRCMFRLAQDLSLTGRPSAAALAWKEYFESGGDAADAWLLRANVAGDLAQHDHSLQFYSEARSRMPDSADCASAELIAACHLAETDAAAQARMTQSWAQRFCADIKSDPLPLRHSNPRRIGFYSPRFAAGPITNLVLPLLKVLHARGIEIYLYSGFEYSDVDTSSFRAVAQVWRSCQVYSDDELVKQARHDELDVMADLCGHAPGNRLRAFAQRMAPLQLSWGDWFASTGVPNMDIFFGDAVLTPPDEDINFSERVVRLPRTRFIYAPPPQAAIVTRPASKQNRPLRLASFNRLSKLSDSTVVCWARILSEVPNAELYLRAAALNEAASVEATQRRFAAHGIAPERVICQGFGSYADVLADYAEVDIALDPFPFNGCVTTLDALWMGVPVVALHGKCLVARQSASLLEAHNCGAWVAKDIKEYVAIVTRLTESKTQCLDHRQQLLAARVDSVLFDVQKFADNWLAALIDDAASKR